MAASCPALQRGRRGRQLSSVQSPGLTGADSSPSSVDVGGVGSSRATPALFKGGSTVGKIANKTFEFMFLIYARTCVLYLIIIGDI